MDAESLKAIALEVLHAGDVGDVETTRKHTTEDFTFRFMEQKTSWTVDGMEVSTTLDKENYLKYGVPAVKTITEDGMHFAVDLVVCEPPYVVIFGRSNATSKKGRKYSNVYAWRMKFTGDKVSEFQEYCDTHHAREVLFE